MYIESYIRYLHYFLQKEYIEEYKFGGQVIHYLKKGDYVRLWDYNYHQLSIILKNIDYRSYLKICLK